MVPIIHGLNGWSKTYEQARAYREYLWETYGPAQDMTGDYVEGDKLEALLRRPTRAHAKTIYVDQIIYWIQIGPDANGYCGFTEEILADPKIQEIAEAVGAEEDWERSQRTYGLDSTRKADNAKWR